MLVKVDKIVIVSLELMEDVVVFGIKLVGVIIVGGKLLKYFEKELEGVKFVGEKM